LLQELRRVGTTADVNELESSRIGSVWRDP
jgi:hypothetical protein